MYSWDAPAVEWAAANGLRYVKAIDGFQGLRVLTDGLRAYKEETDTRARALADHLKAFSSPRRRLAAVAVASNYRGNLIRDFGSVPDAIEAAEALATERGLAFRLGDATDILHVRDHIVDQGPNADLIPMIFTNPSRL